MILGMILSILAVLHLFANYMIQLLASGNDPEYRIDVFYAFFTIYIHTHTILQHSTENRKTLQTEKKQEDTNS